MVKNFVLSKDQVALMLIDIQEKLMPLEDRSTEVLNAVQIVAKAFKILKLPIIATEQAPKKLGSTLPGIKSLLGSEQLFLPKTTFSCLGNQAIKEAVLKTRASQWILVGIEAHVCVLQTAKSLLALGMDVVVLNDAITSRSVYNFATAIAEMRDLGVRITSTETILFELIQEADSLDFKKILPLIK